jgi:hypothetical protein
VAPTFTSILHALVGLVSAFLRLGPWAVVALLAAVLWLVCSRIFRFLEAESRRPLVVAVVLWLWSRRRR